MSIKVPLVFTVFMRSNLFIDTFKVGLRSIAEALLTKMSILPNFSTILLTAFLTSYSFLKSQEIGKT